MIRHLVIPLLGLPLWDAPRRASSVKRVSKHCSSTGPSSCAISHSILLV